MGAIRCGKGGVSMSKNILVIDDDHMVAVTLQKLLRREGYDVFISEDGLGALEKFKNNDFDLIVSDIRMPNISGVEVIHLIKDFALENNRKFPPFIFITGYAEEKQNNAANEAEPNDFLYKPFDRGAFLRSIKAALGE